MERAPPYLPRGPPNPRGSAQDWSHVVGMALIPFAILVCAERPFYLDREVRTLADTDRNGLVDAAEARRVYHVLGKAPPASLSPTEPLAELGTADLRKYRDWALGR